MAWVMDQSSWMILGMVLMQASAREARRQDRLWSSFSVLE